MRDLAQRAAVMRSEANLARDLRGGGAGGGGGAAGASLSLFRHVLVRWWHIMALVIAPCIKSIMHFWPKTTKSAV